MGSTVIFAAPAAQGASACYNAFSLSTVGAQTAGSPFSVTITLKKGGSTATGCHSGTVSLTTGAGFVSPASVASFATSATVSVTLTGAGPARDFNLSGTDVDGSLSTITGASGAFAVSAGALDHFNLSVSPSASITADGSATVSAAARDLYNNARGDAATFNVTAGSGGVGLATGVFTPSLVGTTTIQARNGSVTNTTTITVTVGAFDHVSFTSAPSTTPADTNATFVASAFDAKGNARGDAVAYTSSNATVGAIGASTGVFVPNLVGSSTIKATSGAKNASTTITVTPGGLDHVAFTTAPASTNADTPVTFVAQARDAHDNARSDAIAYGISSGSGAVNAATGVFTPNLVGTTVVSATTGGKSATASLGVTVGALDHVTFLSAPTTTDADTQVSFLAQAYDRHDNPRSDAIAYAVASGSGAIGASTGLFTPNLVGTTGVTATAGSKVAFANLTVTVGALHHLAWSAAPTSTDADTAVTFTAQAFDARGNLRSDLIAYGIASGSGSVGAGTGLFTPNLAGTTTIRASAGALNVTASMTVSPGPLDHVTFTSAPASTDADTPVTFTAQPRDDHENARGDAISYSIASGGGSVSAGGLYTPSTAGSATIRATAGAKHADANLTVTPGPLDHVAFTAAPASTDADHAATFHAVAYDDKGNARSDSIAYGLDSGSGSVDASTGVYTPHLVGNVTIRATAGAKSATATIAVGAGALAQVLVSPAAPTLEAGASQAFSAAGYDAEGNAVPISPAWTATCGSVNATGAYAAPATLGPCDVHAAVGAVSGSATVTVIDDVPPTASASASCALPGSDGWCRGDVTVGTSASDAQTGIATVLCALDGAPVACGSIPVSSPGAHEVDVLATDAAGNTGNASATFRIDAAPPSISIDLTCAAQGEGWCRDASYPYAITSSDATSGVATLACAVDGAPAPCAGTVSGEGPHAFNATATDAAGNGATTSASLGIDSVAPGLDVTLACDHPGADGWCLDASYHYDVSSDDATSGRATFSCQLDGADASCSGTVSGEGSHTVSATATDHAGNAANASASLAIDSVAPAPAILVTCDATGATGWCVSTSYDANASATDATSGVASLTCALDGAASACDATVTGEGSHAFVATATDAAGHAASTNVSLAIDSAAPDVSLAPACAHEGNPGWCLDASYAYNGSASDATSGVASLTCAVDGVSAPCSGTVSGEGPHHIELHATDAAGLSAQASFDLAIDSIAPHVGITPGCATPGTTGWCRSASYTYDAGASDNTSGLADGAPTCALDGVPAPCSGTVSGEGAHTLSLDASDAAGNPAHADLSLAIDSVAPDAAIFADCATPGNAGWCLDASYGYLGGASDETSGLALVACAVDLAPADCDGTISDEGAHHADVVAFDAAGNGAGDSFDLAIDSVAPSLATPANVTIEAEDATGATGTYDAPEASDDTSGAGPVLCDPASGSRFALGHTAVACAVDDAAGHHAEVSFDVLVRDTTAPAIASHDDITAEATSASGANVTFDAPLTSDAVDGAGVSTCDPASGSTFALGNTSVSCGATDAAGNAGVPSTFAVRVLDTTAPLVAPHLDVPAEATGADGATVTFDAPATSDAVDGAGTAICAPASGSLFALGSTEVSCGATDAHGNVALPATFDVIVRDTTAPAIDAHDDVTAEATGSSGANVTYDAPATHDAVDGDGVATCDPASGSLFALGHTTVSCSARDAAGNNASSWFDVRVLDSTSPVIAPHDDVTAEAVGATGANVTYASPATSDAVDGAGVASCDPASGSLFALGNTTVTCSATDSHGNAALATTFAVHVLDTTAPILDAHANESAEATDASGALVTFDAPASHDAVDGDGFASCSPSSGSRFPIGGTLVTCDATDAAGNPAASVTFTVTVSDTTAPAIDAHDDVGAEATGADGAIVTYDAPASHDAVDGEGAATCSPASGSLFALGNTTVTCDATDSSGNAATSTSFRVIVSDTTAPLIAPHDDITAEATGAAGANVTYDAPATSDAVDGNGTASCSPASGSAFALGSTLVTCHAADAAGNAALATTFQVHVLDTTAPILDAHANVTVEATGAEGALVTYDAPASHDAVDGNGTAACSPASGSLFALGSTLVTCDATDAAGNPAASATFHVIVRDTTAPAIDAHLDLAAEATSDAGANVTYDAPATHDAVDGEGVATCVPASGSLFPLGPTTVSCSAQDAAGNLASSSFNVTVDDGTPPTIAPHEDVTAEATGASGANVTYDAPATSDAVDGSGLASCEPASGSLFALGNTTVTCSATDSHGNAASATTFTVRVLDTTAPTIDAHANVTSEAAGPDGATVAYDAPATHDAVDGDGAATCAPASGSLFALGSTAVTCDATDAHGNAALSTTFHVIVQDTTPPTIDAHDDVTAEATGADGANVTYDSPATHDVVDGDGLATCAPASGSTFALGTTIVTCGATDAAGNAATATSFNVTVSDTTAPAIDEHDDITAEATSAGGANATYGSPATHDAVDGAGAATCSPASGSAFALGDTPVACDATDAAGNHAASGFTVHVVDTTAPVIDAHGTVTVEATGASGAFVSYAAPATHDAVDGDGPATCAPASGQTFALGSTKISCAATDAHGNEAHGTSFYVLVRDTTPPHVASHVDVAVEATAASGAHVDYGAIATSDVVDGDGLATCVPAAGSLFAIGTSLVSCGATDAAGNDATGSFNVTVRDTTPPAIAAHDDITVEATSAGGANVTYDAPATTDAVDGAGSASCSPASGSTFALGATLVTCRATDAHGNNATPVGFLVTVQDTTAPTLGNVSDVTVEATSAAGATVNYTAPTVSDLVDPLPTLSCWPASGSTFAIGNTSVACGAFDAHLNGATVLFTVHVRDTTAPTIAPHANATAEATGPLGAYVSYVAPGTSDAVDGAGLAACAPASGSRFAIGDTTVSCGATDAHGNHAARGFRLSVLDTTAPRLNLSGALVVEATGPSGAAVTYLATSYDLVDGAIAPACSPASGATFPLGLTTVWCSATDAHNNTATGSINVTVRDTTAPALSLPAGVSVNATTTTAVVAFNATAYDLVDGARSVSCSPPSGSAFPIGNTTVTCTAQDAAGNNATGSFTVRVVPAIPPTLVLPGSLTATATSAAGANVTFSASAYDTVDGSLRPTCTPASGTRFPVGHTNVTCSVRDSRGLTTTGTFGVNVTYAWSGALLPSMPVVNGANLPVKLKLLGASAPIHDLAAKLYVSRPGGAESPAVSTSKAVSDNSFRYDPSADQYVFDLATKGLASGTWQLRIDLGDGSANTLLVTIK